MAQSFIKELLITLNYYENSFTLKISRINGNRNLQRNQESFTQRECHKRRRLQRATSWNFMFPWRRRVVEFFVMHQLRRTGSLN